MSSKVVYCQLKVNGLTTQVQMNYAELQSD